jgi:hypothetical protein
MEQALGIATQQKKTRRRVLPPAPLILAAWHVTTNIEKMARLREHIQYAAANNALGEV